MENPQKIYSIYPGIFKIAEFFVEILCLRNDYFTPTSLKTFQSCLIICLQQNFDIPLIPAAVAARFLPVSKICNTNDTIDSVLLKAGYICRIPFSCLKKGLPPEILIDFSSLELVTCQLGSYNIIIYEKNKIDSLEKQETFLEFFTYEPCFSPKKRTFDIEKLALWLSN